MDQPDEAPSSRVAMTEREAIADMEDLLSEVEQHRSYLDQWECYHFWTGLRALMARDHERVITEVEYALLSPKQRHPNAEAKVQANPPPDRCSIEILRRELSAVRPR